MSHWRYRVAFERIRFGIAQRFGFDVELLNAAASVDELHATENITASPCIALPGQYERARAGAFGIDIAEEIAQLKGGPREIGPTVRYVLKDVLVCQGIIFGRARWKLFNPAIRVDPVESPWTEYDEVILRSSYVGCHFFGHWLADDCATHLLAEQLGTPMSMPTPPWPDCAGYLALFGQSYTKLGRARVRRLVLFDDIAHNAHKAPRLRALRARVAKHQSSATGRIIYLMRGLGGKPRTLLNEMDIVESLMRRGVIIVQAETLSVPELIAELLGARIVMGIEGSQLSHVLFTLHDKGGVLAILPPDRFFNGYMDGAHTLGMRYGIVVGEQRQSGFYLPVNDLLRTIDLMDTELL
jgi:hypothetical protein